MMRGKLCEKKWHVMPDETVCDAFLDAIRAPDYVRASELLDTDVTLADCRDDTGVSALLLAIYHGLRSLAERIATCREEIDSCEASALGWDGALRHADVHSLNLLSADGYMPLHFAAFFGHTECAAILLARGAEIELPAANASSVRPIHSACACSQEEPSFETMRMLIEAGADVNTRQGGGWAPLHQAAAQGREKAVLFLLKSGANPAARSDDGRLPADVARQHGHLALAEILAGYNTGVS